MKLAVLVTLALCCVGCTAERSRSHLLSAEFTGEVEAGKLYSHSFGERFALVFTPSSHGWHICVMDERGEVDIAAVTRPFRGVTARHLYGLHFRNSDNTGPNTSGPKNVNAPQKVRKFFFTPEVGRDPEVHLRDVPPPFGQGVVTLVEYKLGNLEPGQHAKFESIKFRVRLSWPRTWSVSTQPGAPADADKRRR